ncbi:MAG TPA: hypothetical protein VM187_06005, partial [Niastella sp.]|nr:hypothetical protein [Niastella sp.]
MAYNVVDMEELVEPFFVCDDHLAANLQKGKSVLLLVSLLCFCLTGAVWLLQDSHLQGIIVMLATLPLLGYACYSVAVMHNPMLAIDKRGIAIKSKLYSWDSIDNIFFEKSSNRRKPNRIRFHLKNGGLITFYIPIFFDQQPSIIA